MPGERAIAGLDHAVIETSEPEATMALYGDGLGLRLALDREFPQWGARLIFYRVGDITVELAARLDAQGGTPGRDRFFGLSWRVPDADAARARLVAAGIDASEVRPGRKPGTRVLTVRRELRRPDPADRADSAPGRLHPPMAAAQKTTEFPAELEAEIRRLKRERNAVILAHYYQESEIQDLADFVGDSLELSQQAAKTKADVIVFCGVHFMAETAKILNPEQDGRGPRPRRRLLARRRLPGGRVRGSGSQQYPGHAVVSYINCSAAVKALSDVICTSSQRGARSSRRSPRTSRSSSRPTGTSARWVEKQTGRDDLVLWQGTCIVHEKFTARAPARAEGAAPRRRGHRAPRVRGGDPRHADFIALDDRPPRVREESPKKTFIVATEDGHPPPDAEGARPTRR